ncbi:hypothetical protein BDW67DRAFT_162226 [Aspergillus spinulosporus]
MVRKQILGMMMVGHLSHTRHQGATNLWSGYSWSMALEPTLGIKTVKHLFHMQHQGATSLWSGYF